VDVCYKVHGVVAESFASPDGNNHLHALQERFERRMVQGRFYRTPCLGWSEFTPSYFGPLRESTRACPDVDLRVPSMLRRVFNKDSAGLYGPVFDQDVKVEKGVLSFAQ
jgi:CRISPR-associated protein Cas5d